MLEGILDRHCQVFVQVQGCKGLRVNVDRQLWQNSALRDQVVDVSAIPVGLSWHTAPKGASMVSTYHATLQVLRTETKVFPGVAGTVPDLKMMKVSALPVDYQW